MKKNNRSYRGVLDLKEQVLFIGSLAIFLLGGLLWYNYVHRTILLTPQDLFKEAFTEPIESIENLEGEHSLSFGNDFWIKFRSFTPVHLRNAQEFKPSVAEVGRGWFSNKWPDDRSLHDIASNYQFYMYHLSPGNGKVIQNWLLINKNQHRYYYRHWSM